MDVTVGCAAKRLPFARSAFPARSPFQPPKAGTMPRTGFRSEQRPPAWEDVASAFHINAPGRDSVVTFIAL